MNGSRIAEESGVDYDEVTSDSKDLYECGRCDEIIDLSKFIDTECDGDVIGTCPNCGTRTLIFPVS